MASEAVPNAAAAASIVRQARPIGGAYCIISVNDDKTGVVITAYDSEACVEKQLRLTYDEATTRLDTEVRVRCNARVGAGAGGLHAPAHTS